MDQVASYIVQLLWKLIPLVDWVQRHWEITAVTLIAMILLLGRQRRVRERRP